MKSKIIITIFIVAIILFIVLATVGFKIGSFQIPSVSEIIAKNKQIYTGIEKASILTSSDYPQKISELDKTINNLNVQKQKYEQLSEFSDENNKSIYETEKYDIVYLWNTLGHYANKNSIKMTMDVKKTSNSNLYDLSFTVEGEYTDISTFITKLENDSELSFRIYNFKMTKGKASFVVKDVNIDETSLIKQSTSVANINNNKKEETKE